MRVIAFLALAVVTPALAAADVCLDRPWHDTMSANSRAEVEILCESDETLVGVFTENHPGSFSYWLDGVGVLCEDSTGTVERRYNTADLDLTAGEFNDIDCDGETPTGIATNLHTQIGRTHIDAAALMCGDDQSLTDFPDRESDNNNTTLGCGEGEELVGLAYKDHDNRDGLAFTDAVGFIAPICAAFDAAPEAVEFNQWLMNTRDPVELTCADGEIFVGAFYDDHSSPGADWVDGFGIYCADAADTSAVVADYESDDIDADEDHVLSCGDGGVSGLTYSEVTSNSRDRVDGIELVCADGTTSGVTENLDSADASPSCPAGEVAVGLAYRDAQTTDNTWSDGVQSVTVMCAPATCQ